MMDERDKLRRKKRLTIGAGSSLPIAVIVTFLYSQYFHKEMDTHVAIAFASLAGSFGTGLALCFHDIRAIFCGYLIKKGYIKRVRRTDDITPD